MHCAPSTAWRNAFNQSESLSACTCKARSWQLLCTGEGMCTGRGELEVAKNPAEQEEHHVLGPRSDWGKISTGGSTDTQLWLPNLCMCWRSPHCLAACCLSSLSDWEKSWEQLLGFANSSADTLSHKSKVPLSPRVLGDALVTWFCWCSTSGSVAPLLLPPVWSTAALMDCLLPALGTWQEAAGAAAASHQM